MGSRERCIVYHAVGMQAPSSVPQRAAWEGVAGPVEPEMGRGRTGRCAHICYALLYSWQRAAPRREAQSLQTAQTFGVGLRHSLHATEDRPLAHDVEMSRLGVVAMSTQGEKTDAQVSWPAIRPLLTMSARWPVYIVYLCIIHMAQKSRTHTSPRHHEWWLGQAPPGAPRHVRG